MNKTLDLKPLAPLVAGVRQGQLLTLLPQALEGLFPGLGFVLFAFCPGQAPRCLVDNLSPSKGHQAIGPYLGGMYQLDPLYNYAQECPADALVSLKQIMPIGFRQSDYYRQYYRNLQLDGEMALCIRRDDALLVLSIGFYGRRVPRSLRDDLALLQPLLRAFLIEGIGTLSSVEADSPVPALLSGLPGEEQLSPREQQVAHLILRGFAGKAIARQLGISPETVKIHRRHLYRKLMVGSQAELFGRFMHSRGFDPAALGEEAGPALSDSAVLG